MKGRYKPMLNLRSMRIRKGITQVELSQKLGKSKNLIYLYESGYISPPRSKLEKIATELGCEVKDII